MVKVRAMRKYFALFLFIGLYIIMSLVILGINTEV